MATHARYGMFGSWGPTQYHWCRWGWGGVSGGLELHSDMQGGGAEAVLVSPVAQNGGVQWRIRSACRPQAFYHIPGTPVSTTKDPTTSQHHAPGKLFHLPEWDPGPPSASPAYSATAPYPSPSEDVRGVPVLSCSKVASPEPSWLEFAFWE